MAFRMGRDRGQSLTSAGAMSAVGIAFVLAIVAGTAGGYLLDRWLGTAPWFFFLGFILGFAAGVVNVYRAANLR
jgi:ATP synthase protein I